MEARDRTSSSQLLHQLSSIIIFVGQRQYVVHQAKKVDVQRVSALPGDLYGHVYMCLLQSHVIEVCI